MEDCLGPVLIGVIVIAIAIWLIGVILTLIGLVLVAIGTLFILCIDFCAHGFSLVGAGSPEIGWLLLGLFAGGVAGLVMGLKRAGRKRDLPKVYGGTAVAGLLLLIGSGSRMPARNSYSNYSSGSNSTYATSPMTNSNNSPSLKRLPSVTGTWHGYWGNSSGNMIIDRQNGGNFHGRLINANGVKVELEGQVKPGTHEISIRETRVISGRWILGRNTGSLSSDGKRMSGTGRDKNHSYSWSETKTSASIQKP